MSASGWSPCPRCRARAKAKAQSRLDAVKETYGNVPADQFTEELIRAQADFTTAATTTKFETFREDWEIYGAETGTVTVDYGGTCTVCGLRLTFNEEHPIPGMAE